MNKTKTQYKKALGDLYDRLLSIQSEAEDLKAELEEEAEEIEPYEGKDELTPAQEERQEWLESQAEALDELIDLSLDIDDLDL